MIKKNRRKQGSGITSFFAEKLTEGLNLDKFFKNIDTANHIIKALSAKKR